MIDVTTNNDELTDIDGGGFWDGVFCGFGVVLMIAEVLGSPVTAGMSDIALAGTALKTIQSCNAAAS